MTNKFCTNCGKEISNNSNKFCISCGQEIGDNDIGKIEEESKTWRDYQTKQNKVGGNKKDHIKPRMERSTRTTIIFICCTVVTLLFSAPWNSLNNANLGGFFGRAGGSILLAAILTFFINWLIDKIKGK